MARRPAHCYRKIAGSPYTRREYIRSVPGSKISSFDAGNRMTKFPVTISLFAKEACQIRHVALEAARMMTNRCLQRDVGWENYHFKVRVFPHHIIRENKMMAFAGADRIQDGMRRAFGKPTGTAARVEAGQAITTVYTHPRFAKEARYALKTGGDKLPTPYTIDIEEGEELVKALELKANE